METSRSQSDHPVSSPNQNASASSEKPLALVAGASRGLGFLVATALADAFEDCREAGRKAICALVDGGCDTDGAIEAAQAAMDQAGISPDQVGLLVNCSVTRDGYEPALASGEPSEILVADGPARAERWSQVVRVPIRDAAGETGSQAGGQPGARLAAEGAA